MTNMTVFVLLPGLTLALSVAPVAVTAVAACVVAVGGARVAKLRMEPRACRRHWSRPPGRNRSCRVVRPVSAAVIGTGLVPVRPLWAVTVGMDSLRIVSLSLSAT